MLMALPWRLLRRFSVEIDSDIVEFKGKALRKWKNALFPVNIPLRQLTSIKQIRGIPESLLGYPIS